MTDKCFKCPKCPKCNKTSGDSWTQCDGICPMPMSPHYQVKLTLSDRQMTRKEHHTERHGLDPCWIDSAYYRNFGTACRPYCLTKLGEYERLKNEMNKLRAQADEISRILDRWDDLVEVVTASEMGIRGLICAKEGYKLIDGDLGQIYPSHPHPFCQKCGYTCSNEHHAVEDRE